MVKKLELSEGCSRCAPMTVASPIAAATRAYSIAVKPASAARKFRGAAIARIDLRHGGTGMVVTPALVNSSLQISMKCLAVQAGNLEDFWR